MKAIKELFTTIQSGDNKFEVWVQRPNTKGHIIIALNFDPMTYPNFIKAIEALDYVCLLRCKTDTEYSFMQLAFIQSKSQLNAYFVNFIEELPELMHEHVEKQTPINRKQLGNGTAGHN